MSAPAKRSFASGELAPVFHARSDTATYQTGLRELENAYVMRTGGAQSRPGSAYKGATKSNGVARLVPCVFDEDQNYLLEFGVSYVRFWRDGAQVTATVTGAWADATAYLIGQVVSYSGTNYVALQAHTSVLATNRPTTGSSWADYWHALTGTIYELPTPYTTQTILRTMQVQSTAGVLRIAHRDFERRNLTRYADNRWGIALASASVPLLDAPDNLVWTGTSGTAISYIVTAYSSVYGSESMGSTALDTNADLTTLQGAPETLSWDAVVGATVYRVYRSDEDTGGIYGLVIGTTGLAYTDNGGIVADVGQNPPEAGAGFGTPGEYPGVLGSYQQRLIVGGSTNAPDEVQTSRSGTPDDFTVSNPLVDADAVSWRMVGPRVVRPRHFVEIAGGLWQLSNLGEELVQGDDTGILTPGSVNPTRYSSHGASVYPSPLPIDNAALYVQARGSLVRHLLPDGTGADLTLLSSHLVDGYTIPEWCYQETPHSIVWAVRSDGVLLSLTYERASGVFGWARHTTDGTVESVACVPEGTEDAVYVLVNRTINGGTVRYIERLVARTAAVAALACSDASLTAVQPFSTVTVTEVGFSIPDNAYVYNVDGAGGSGSFAVADIGRSIGFRFNDVAYSATILTRTDANTISIGFLTDPPFGATENFAKPDWWMNPVGFAHLNGEAVSVQLDGVVYASPNNPDYATVTVSGGVVPINSGYDTAIVGLPFTVDIETLDMDGAGSSRKDAAMNITRVGVWYEESRLPFVAATMPTTANSVTGMQAMPTLDEDENTTTAVISGYREGMPDGAWTRHGRVALRHVDPSPLTVLAIIPQGHAGRS